jgi:outer membrane immunogenic protein
MTGAASTSASTAAAAFGHNCWTNAGVGGVPTIPGVAEDCHDASGGMVGGQTGCRWQSANWVIGLEGQGDWADFIGSNASIFDPAVTNRTKLDAIGLITGQVGYAWNNVL